MALLDFLRRRRSEPMTSAALEQVATTLALRPDTVEDLVVHRADPQAVPFSHATYSTVADMRVNPETSTQIAGIWACMDVIASAESSSDWNVYGGIRGEANKLAMPRDPLQYILNTRWNSEMTAQAGKRAVGLAAAGWGTGYAEIEWDMAGRIKALWPIAPHRVEARRDMDTGELFYRITQEYRGGWVDLKPEDLFIVRGASMVGFAGDNILSHAIRTVGVALAIDQYAASYFGNNAQLGTVFMYKGNMDDKAYGQAKESLTQRHAGVRKAYTTGIMHGGEWDIKSFGQSMDKSLYNEVKAMTLDDICFIPGTKVLTPEGLKAIEAIKVGESVLTHKGRWRRVRNVMTRPYVGSVVRVQAKGLSAVTATTNHPFYAQVVKPDRSHRQHPVGAAQWVAAGDLSAGTRRESDGQRGRGEFHALTVPKLVDDVGILRLDMAEWVSHKAPRDKKSVRYSTNHRATPVHRYVALNADLGWLCGIYASDGSIGDHQVVFYLGAHEIAATAKLRIALKKVFGVDCSTSRTGSVDRTSVSNQVLVEFFRGFGGYAHVKKLPAFCLAGSPDFRAGVIAGLIDGDGCVYQGRMSVRSTSEALAWQLRLLLWSNGWNGSMTTACEGVWEINGRSGVSRPIHTVEWRPNADVRGFMGVAEDYAYFNLSSVEKSVYSGVVHNLEVEEDESYTTEGGCVHNCRWFHVPPHKIAHLAKSTNNNIEHQGLEFSRDTMRPWKTEIEQEADYKLIAYRGPPKFIEMDMDWAEQGDYKSRMEAYAAGRNIGVFSGNDVLRKLGENTIGEDGDIRIVQGAMVRLEDVGAAYTDQPGTGAGTAPADKTLQAWLTTVYARVARRRATGAKDCAAFAREIVNDLAVELGDRLDAAQAGVAEVLAGEDPTHVANNVINRLEKPS